MSPSAESLMAAVSALRHQLRSIDLDEATTFTRVDVRARIDTFDKVLRLLGEYLPDVEVEAVMALGYTRIEATSLIGGAMAA